MPRRLSLLATAIGTERGSQHHVVLGVHGLCPELSRLKGKLAERNRYVGKPEAKCHGNAMVAVQGGEEMVEAELQRNTDSVSANIVGECIEMRGCVHHLRRRPDFLTVDGAIAGDERGGQERAGHRQSVGGRCLDCRIWPALEPVLQ